MALQSSTETVNSKPLDKSKHDVPVYSAEADCRIHTLEDNQENNQEMIDLLHTAKSNQTELEKIDHDPHPVAFFVGTNNYDI